jgi:hypothetical protein
MASRGTLKQAKLGLRTDPTKGNSQSSELSVDPRSLPLSQAKNSLEQFPQEIALAKAAMAVLGKRRMVGDVAIETQATKPAVGKIEVDLVAQPPF